MTKEKIYTLIEEKDGYSIFKDGQIFTTPACLPVRTKTRTLAERLIKDLNALGDDPSDPASIFAFHAPMIDFFSVQPRSQLEKSVSNGLSNDFDWTMRSSSAEPNFMMNWLNLFGNGGDQLEKGVKWIKTLSLSQHVLFA